MLWGLSSAKATISYHFYLSLQLSQAFLRVDNVKLPGATIDAESGIAIYSQIAENSTSLLETTSISSISGATARMSYMEVEAKFTALQYALFSMCFIEVIGAAFFFITSFYVVSDKKKVDTAIQGE